MPNRSMISLLKKRPHAVAHLQGSNKYPSLRATVSFYQMADGVLVSVYATGLPTGVNICESPIYAMHIHTGTSCNGNETDPFAAAMAHYNPNDCPHPYHAGDLPPLFAANGYAVSVFFTNRFTVNEVIGKTAIIHSNPDDFTTQPSGNSGEKMACGVITASKYNGL